MIVEQQPIKEEKPVIEGEVKPKEFNQDEITARLEKLEQTNVRLLDESKTYKQKWQGLRTEVEKENEQRLTEKENWKELLEIEKNKNFEALEKVKSFKKQSLQKSIHFEVARNASNAFDVNDIIKNLPADMVSIDEDSLEVRGVKDAVEFVKTNKPYLFDTKKTTGMVSDRPIGDNGKRTYEELNKDEQDALFKEALTQMG